MNRIIECVPNFSEGRDRQVIDAIAEAIAAVEGVRLLDVDPGPATHRTVMTFAGRPEAVVEAAFRGAREAAGRIDMRRHAGEHPRFGAVDVVPLVPVSGVTMEEAADHARRLARRIGEELGIPVYLYAHAASAPERRELAYLRSGEYEGLEAKLAKPEWAPDFGPARFNARSGAAAVGAREFLVAYNVNLNTTSVRRANAVAFDVRESGRLRRDEAGRPLTVPGSLKAVRAIGWYLEEHGLAQVSMNLTDLGVTPLHAAFEEVCRRAEARGLRVTGSQIVGLVPLACLLDAGRHFLRRQRRSAGVPDEELLRTAVRSLGLNELYPFKPEEKIVEYALAGPEGDRSHGWRRAVRAREGGSGRLAALSLRAFAGLTASDSPTPGGGSVAACAAALGAALGAMVANLSAHRPGGEARWEEFSGWAEKAIRLQQELLGLVDEDARAFQAVMAARRLPRAAGAEKERRDAAVRQATRAAMEVPLRVMEAGLAAMEVVQAMAREGPPGSASDAGVGALAARCGVLGAHLNVKINARGLPDDPSLREALEKAERMARSARQLEEEILELAGRAIDRS